MNTSAVPAVCRFAPSPTGKLHVGNARMALVNALLAMKTGGAMILRLDDTDTERSTDAFAQGIRDDLVWLGLRWRREEKQSERLARYDAAADALRAAGRLYACYETAEELDAMRARLRRRGKPPIYDRAALGLSEAQKAAFETDGRRPHWRFKLNPGAIEWDDAVRGPQHFDGANLSDPVLIREDGTYLYMLPSAVDDVDMGVTHVIRGEDHVTNTAIQMQIFEALGAAPPAFAHLALLTGADGEALSKRLGSTAVSDYREAGFEPMAVNALLARLGSSEAVEPALDLDALAHDFDLSHFGRAQARFDPAELARLNARVLHAMDYGRAKPRLDALGLSGVDEALWDVVRPNLEIMADASHWLAVARGTIEPVREDAAFLRAAAEALPPEPFDETAWKTWTAAVKAATGAKGKALFQPLRLALTGLDHGPEMAALLPLIGRERALERLGG